MDWQVRENGLDLTVGPRVAVAKDCILDPYHMSRDEIASCFEEAEIPDEGIVLKPGNVYLLHTGEYVRMPDGVVGLANLKSTLARRGVLIPPTIVDAGFEGEIVIEVQTGTYVRIYKGMPFLHLVLLKADGRGNYREGGRYMGQRGITYAKPLKHKKQ